VISLEVPNFGRDVKARGLFICGIPRSPRPPSRRKRIVAFMAFRFHKSIRVLPGVRIDLNKRSTSISIGGRGAHVTVGHGKVRETIGLPGTGVSYTHVSSSHQAKAEAPGPAQPAPLAEPPQDEPLPVGVAWRGWVWLLLIVLIVGALVVQALR